MAAPKPSILLLDDRRERRGELEDALVTGGYRVAVSADASAPLVKLAERHLPDAIVAVFPRPTDGLFQALSAVHGFAPCASVLFSEDGAQETIERAVQAGISSYVVDGLIPERLCSVVGVALARFRGYQRLTRELEEAKRDLASRKLIEKAKGIIMERSRQSENEAYHALRKLAMNQNKTIAEVARNLISTAELLN